MRRLFWSLLVLTTLLSLDSAWASEAKNAEVVSADRALELLQWGNRRFVAGTFRAEGRGPSTRRKIASQTNPHSVVLSCSESAVPPELVFDQALGEIFAVRVMGPVIDGSVLASIEYAISNLGVRHLFVLGHDRCGVVQAATQKPNAQEKFKGSKSMEKLVSEIRPRIDRGPAAISSKSAEIESGLNARQVAEDLVNRSVIIAEALRDGKLHINSGMYHLDSGKVDFY